MAEPVDIVTDLIVLIADIPSAPAKWQLKANLAIESTLGVIFGITGIFTAFFT